jgi:hypothetical protein
MASKLGAIVLIVATLFCLLTTVSAGIRPERFAEQLGMKIVNAGGTNEVYAQYAGFFLAVAIVCLIALLCTAGGRVRRITCRSSGQPDSKRWRCRFHAHDRLALCDRRGRSPRLNHSVCFRQGVRQRRISGSMDQTADTAQVTIWPPLAWSGFRRPPLSSMWRSESPCARNMSCSTSR